MDNKETLLLNFAKHLTKMRLEKGMSIRQLAASAGLEYSQVQRIEKGKVNFAFSTLIAISNGLQVSVAELLAGF